MALAGKERRGKLLVFLGAAPSVGKTYAMLRRAGLLKQGGVDVVVGPVETHGRAETEALTAGLEILPRRTVYHQGRRIEEFDLDGALKRRSKLVIVDELAHTNSPDSRHPKRWQDVEELLDARIDVCTALSVQHVESLADGVARVTGVGVRETAPDIVRRDDVQVVTGDGGTDAGPFAGWRRRWMSRPARGELGGLLAAASAVAAAAPLGKGLTEWAAPPNLSMIFLAAVIVCAVRLGVQSAIAAAGI